MGTGGGLFEAGDKPLLERLNRKTWYIGSTAPSTTYPGMPWFDTSTDTPKIRNKDDNGWIDLTGEPYGYVQQPLHIPYGGATLQSHGVRVDNSGECAIASIVIPEDAAGIEWIKIIARSVVAEADKMRLEIDIEASQPGEPHATHDLNFPNHQSDQSNFAVYDRISWTISSGFSAIQAGDELRVKCQHEAAGDGDCATQASFATIYIKYSR